jgi:hypothetical protein
MKRKNLELFSTLTDCQASAITGGINNVSGIAEQLLSGNNKPGNPGKQEVLGALNKVYQANKNKIDNTITNLLTNS